MADTKTKAALIFVLTNMLWVKSVDLKKELPQMLSTVPHMLNTECRMRHIQIVLRVKNCVPLRIVTRACGGACASYTTTSAINPTKLETNCDCCQYVGRRKKYFAIRCFTKNKKRRSIRVATFTLPRGCRCRPCSAISNRIVSAEADIFQTSPILGELINSKTFKRSSSNNSTYFVYV